MAVMRSKLAVQRELARVVKMRKRCRARINKYPEGSAEREAMIVDHAEMMGAHQALEWVLGGHACAPHKLSVVK